ncbi:hypothetical protein PCANC_19693 [Puccinia coronata f. sp. avenae]|uniref:Chorismate-utilising enzyme C-terminal domain-containing protein n=1 Tax=Puccinia coronata f. sp. avenae TaxID=200324 RepID=A0A2N5SAW2_9BASI|nr:hypothetical protein PCANC_19693 [Puccinia coronata f. sp. avenae]
MDQIASELFEEIIYLSSDYIGYTIAQKLFEKCSEMFASNKDAHVVALCAASGHHRVSQERDDSLGNYVMQCCLRAGSAHEACRRMRTCLESKHAGRLQIKRVAIVVILNSIPRANNPNGTLQLTCLLDSPCAAPRPASLATLKLVLEEILGDQAHEVNALSKTQGRSPQMLPRLLVSSDRQGCRQILCDSIGVALHSLSIPINPSGVSSDTTSSASEEQMPELTPIQLSKLLSIIISDTPIPSTEKGKEPKLLWKPTIANHCLADAKFNSNPSPIALLYRICSAPVICSADLCKTVLLKTKRGAGPEAEEVAEQLGKLIELANKYGNEFPIDHVSWIRAIGKVYNNRIYWSEVIKLTFDQPAKQVTLPNGWGLRFLGKVLSLAPSLAASSTKGSSPTSTADNTLQVDSTQGPSSSTKGQSLSTSSQSSLTPSPPIHKNPLPLPQNTAASTAAISSLFKRWTHQYTKIRLINLLLYLPLDASLFLHVLKLNPLAPMNGPSCKKVVSAKAVLNNSPTVTRVLVKSVEMSRWNVKELLCEVVKLLSPQYSFLERQTEKDEMIDKIIEKATNIMERACKTNPELVMMALIQVPVRLHLNPVNVLKSAFLPGSMTMTGAPKPLRIKILDRLAHAARRGLYSGILDFIAVDGRTNMSHFIRAVLICNNHIPLGAITSRLKKENQWSEVRLKDDAVQRTLSLHLKLQQQQQHWQLQLQQQQHQLQGPVP